MNVSEEYKITTGTINGASIKRVDIEPSIIVDGKSYTASEFNKAVEMLKQPQLRPVVIREKKEEHAFSEITSVRYCVSCEYTDTEIKGKFHQWISEYAANEYGERSNLYAVVEMNDGTIALYEHDLIRFID
ncbi:hypothetical protein N2H42_12995 [Enterococcus faecium]|uniref:hypothetical protein n=1 Tax=Enterococcus gallinarum TaxID=1353 RepID=UPI0014739EA2|nr:hypothetical protein [Enterococcus gallinarum]MCU1914668.1 hypothetical protein [Enterococcus faecium]